jgi:uncharacterized protein YodC (DUF2158 family)
LDYHSNTSVGVKMARNFVIGETVQLKSGGSKMVIREFEVFEGVLQARCEWMERGKPQTGSFAVTSLKHVD